MVMIQEKLYQLAAKGWTYAAMADALNVHVTTVYGWRAGRIPTNAAGVELLIDRLLKRKRIPKLKRYPRGRFWRQMEYRDRSTRIYH